MSHEYDAEDAAYEARIADMVLVDLVGTDKPYEELFAVKRGGEVRAAERRFRNGTRMNADSGG